jgi:hypothetical protein
VSGKRTYRGHEPGEEFEASLDTVAAGRAVGRGDLLLLEEFTPTLPDTYELPKGWL